MILESENPYFFSFLKNYSTDEKMFIICDFAFLEIEKLVKIFLQWDCNV